MPKRAKTRPAPDGMNRTERAYSELLETLRRAGEIQTWRFEPLKFKIGKACFYTPDFEVVRADGELEYHEVKGFWRDDARVKIRAVAALFPDRRFLAVSKARKGLEAWKVEEF